MAVNLLTYDGLQHYDAKIKGYIDDGDGENASRIAELEGNEPVSISTDEMDEICL